MKLTDIQVKNAKAESKPRKLSDGRGLYLYVSPAGGKSWRLDYDFFGKRKTLTVGAYPQVGLADARKLRDEAKKKLRRFRSVAKKRDLLAAKAAAGNTFGLIADEFIDKLRRDKRAEPTITKNRWMLKNLAEKLGPYPITHITARDVLAVLTTIENVVMWKVHWRYKRRSDVCLDTPSQPQGRRTTPPQRFGVPCRGM